MLQPELKTKNFRCLVPEAEPDIWAWQSLTPARNNDIYCFHLLHATAAVLACVCDATMALHETWFFYCWAILVIFLLDILVTDTFQSLVSLLYQHLP